MLQRRNLPQTCHHEKMSAAGSGVSCFAVAWSKESRGGWHQLHSLCFFPTKVSLSMSTASTAHSLSCIRSLSPNKRKSVLWYFNQLQWCDFYTVSTVCVWPFPVVWTWQCPCAKSSIKKSLSQFGVDGVGPNSPDLSLRQHPGGINWSQTSKSLQPGCSNSR